MTAALQRIHTLDAEVAHLRAELARLEAEHAQARTHLERVRQTLAAQATAHLRLTEEAQTEREKLRAEVAHLRRQLARR